MIDALDRLLEPYGSVGAIARRDQPSNRFLEDELNQQKVMSITIPIIFFGVAAFLLNALAPLADWLEPWQKASAFHWALGENPLRNGMDWPMAGVLAAACVALVLVAAAAYSRHDIGGR